MIAWTPDMSVQVVEIDDQHKKFIEMMKEIETAVNAQLDRSVIGAILIKLAGYAHYHFGTEEKYFALFHFKEAKAHRAAHELFSDMVREYRKRFEQGEDVALEVMNFMFEWLTNHIKTMDQRYVDCFHEHGLR